MRERQRAKAAGVLAAAQARHAAARARLDGEKLREVLDHHGPCVYETESWAHCAGCDPGAYAEDDPEWPCSTWLLIMGEDESPTVVDGAVLALEIEHP